MMNNFMSLHGLDKYIKRIMYNYTKNNLQSEETINTYKLRKISSVRKICWISKLI